MTTAVPNILLVEDSAADIALIEEFVEELQLPAKLHITRDGEPALRFLRREGEYAAAPRPELILLDLNLPARDGLDMLYELRNDADEDLRIIPVLVLTTSHAPTDVRTAYRLGANAYVTKPANPDEFRRALRSIASFWIHSAELPGRCPA